MKISKQEYNEAKQVLLSLLKPNDTVFTILRHVSKSGMSRDISLVIPSTDYEGRLTLYCIDHLVHKVLGYSFARGNKHGLQIGGCGMDMGFSMVYNLGCVLWPNGTPIPHGHRNGEPDSTGGYALNQQWI